MVFTTTGMPAGSWPRSRASSREPGGPGPVPSMSTSRSGPSKLTFCSAYPLGAAQACTAVAACCSQTCSRAACAVVSPSGTRISTSAAAMTSYAGRLRKPASCPGYRAAPGANDTLGAMAAHPAEPVPDVDPDEAATAAAALREYRESVAAGRPGAVSHEEAMAELLGDIR